jgi:hypothetical protein
MKCSTLTSHSPIASYHQYCEIQSNSPKDMQGKTKISSHLLYNKELGSCIDGTLDPNGYY